MGGHKCHYRSCYKSSSLDKGLQIFTVPRGKKHMERRKVWLENAGLSEIDEHNIMELRICEHHFKNEYFYVSESNRRLLRRHAVPTPVETTACSDASGSATLMKATTLDALSPPRIDAVSTPKNEEICNLKDEKTRLTSPIMFLPSQARTQYTRKPTVITPSHNLASKPDTNNCELTQAQYKNFLSTYRYAEIQDRRVKSTQTLNSDININTIVTKDVCTQTDIENIVPEQEGNITKSKRKKVSVEVQNRNEIIKQLRKTVLKLNRQLRNKSRVKRISKEQVERHPCSDKSKTLLNMLLFHKKGRNWTSAEKTIAEEIFYRSPAAYRLLRSGCEHAFPSRSSLVEWTRTKDLQTDICTVSYEEIEILDNMSVESQYCDNIDTVG